GALASTSATMLWDTDENSNSKLHYGPEETMEFTEEVGEMVQTHSVSINGLVDGWHYYYKVESCDERGNCAESSVDDFVAGSDYEPPFITTNIPEYYNEIGLDFDVETEAFADVKVYVSDILSRSSNAGDDGEVHFDNIMLKSILPVNVVKVEAIDAAENSAFEEYNVYLDFEAPELVIQTNVSEVIKQGSFSVQGYVNEQSTVSFYIEQEPFSFNAPGKVEGLYLEPIDIGFIEFSWNRSDSNDFDEYLVYREDVGLIGIAPTELFTDTNIVAGQTYNYWVSALDYDCLEGEYSDKLIVKALEAVESAEVEEEIEPVVPECRQKKPILQIETSGSFNEQLSLREGNNKLIIVAEDIYGNSVNVSYDSLYDSLPPTFNSINLDQISPSYNQQITISGNLSEPCTLVVSVNGKNVSSGQTDESGLFSIDVKLDKENPVPDGSGDVGWYNEVKIIATDRGGNIIEDGDTIDFMMCGSSNPLFGIIPKSLSPTELTPRLLYEGMGQITFELELQWLGYGDEPVVSNSAVNKLYLSMEQEKHYDSDILNIMNIPTSRNPGEQSIAVILDIGKIDPTTTDKNWSIYDIEKNISKRHSGYCFTHADLMSGGLDGIEGPGCIRVPLDIEIKYPTEDYERNPIVGIQKECLFVDVLIQPAVDIGDSIPRGMLEGMIKMLDPMIETIDKILKPIRQVSTWLMYGCLGMRVVHLGTKAAEWFSCKALLVDSLMEELDLDGISSCSDCEIESDGSVTCEKSECSSCVSARLNTLSVEKAMHLICDRVTCNSIPSFSTYAQNQEDYSFTA
ncbi:MAG: fibronectin type III domain-containing protein, partial [Chlamydiia bacterium]|nr:fibronectin type III domain-containing protein [Chlamydiia bacterium]